MARSRGSRIAGGLALTIASSASLAAPPPPSARSAPELRVASTHPMRYWISLPAGHTPVKRRPVLVVVADAHRDFRGDLEAFAAAADAPLILLAPLVLTCGRPHRGDPYPYDAAAWAEADRSGDFGFDRDGLAAVLADVRRRDGGEDKVAITGWEAGGHTVWALLFQRPEWFRAAVPVSTNFLGRWIDEDSFSRDPIRARLPVRVLFCGTQTGELETARQHLLSQTRDAIAKAKGRGFGDVTERILDGRPHGPLAADVLDVLASVAAR